MVGVGTKRRKKRTHVQEPELVNEEKIPKSLVVRVHSKETEKPLTRLTRDFRKIMDPNTASRLKERRRNCLKDFITMAGPLGVTHLIMFSRGSKGPNFKIACTPQGPTLRFRIDRYMLIRDVVKTQKKPKSLTFEYENPPVLVMSGFKALGRKTHPEETLLVSTFQNLFPTISSKDVNLSNIRRVLLLEKNEKNEINLRHYVISFKKLGLSKPIRKLTNKSSKSVPDLQRVRDISDFVMNNIYSGFSSDSEVEDDQILQSERSEPTREAIKLTEIGPRLSFQLESVQEGLCEGKTIYNLNFSKTRQQAEQLELRHKLARELKENRKAIQKENIIEKQAKKKKVSFDDQVEGSV